MKFEIERELLDATRNGMFGGPVDTHRVMAPGLIRYLIDGQSVTKKQFKQAVALAKKNGTLTEFPFP